MHARFPRRPGAAVLCAALSASIAAPAFADDAALRREFEEKLRQALAEQESRHRAEMDRLRSDLSGAASRGGAPSSELQDRMDDLAAELRDVKTRLPQASSTPSAFRLVDVSLNALVTGGTSTGTESEIQELQQSGHDPQKRGFTLQNSELILTGAVDPYFTAQMNLLALISPEGETEVELEEVWAQTTQLGGGFQVKAGQFLSPIGRHNLQHPHQWDFVDAPVVSTRILGGDGMRGPGAQVSWLADGLPLELTYALQNANGETVVSFLGTDEDAPPAGRFVEREVRSFGDLAHTARAAWSADIDEQTPLLLGASAAFGPSGASVGGDARVFGADATLKWRPADAQHGFPFLSLRGEMLRRIYEFDDGVGVDELRDGGWYAQGTWGFTRNWTVGARYDSFGGDFGGRTPGLDDRTRVSLALTHWTSEFAKVRLQVNRDDAESMDGDVTSIWLQLEFNLGAHGAHRF
ncbi:MAG: hypothetical protein HMLKMBBP_02044 [Planctomycetes bacterium]|nr:hypothetical protein [Planctomycetota bacterium]